MPETLKTIASFADLFSPFERTDVMAQKPHGVMQYMPQQKPVSNSFLRQRYPQTYGFLGGLMGTAPDEFEGSVLDPLSAQVRKGAEIGFPLGVALDVSPLAVASGKPLGQAARIGMRNIAQPTTLNRQFGGVMMGEKATAPVDPLGFYSAVEDTALNLQRKSGQGQAFLNDIMKGANVKADEVKWLGLDDFLKGKPNVTKQEVQDYIAANKVDLQEVELGSGTVKTFEQWASDQGLTPEAIRDFGPSLRNSYEAFKENASQMKDAAKFGQYTLPGGENYREILLTMPFKEPAMPKGYEVTSVKYDDGSVRYFANTPTTRSSAYKTEEDAMNELQRMTSSLKGFRENQQAYKSSHWDQPNVLAHMRVNDRVDADGKKMLLIEEVQSDWHQAGRTKGYKSDVNPEENKALVKQWDTLAGERKDLWRIVENGDDADPAVQRAVQRLGEVSNELGVISDRLAQIRTIAREGVPDAPFKDNWYQLALKRAMKYAADNGYDRIGLTTGSRQAERYDLSKQISRVVYNEPGSKRANKFGTVLYAFDKNGDQVLAKTVAPEDLADHIGKDAAKKLLDSPADSWGQKEIQGMDLSVGGEGMKKYYDEIYPKFLDKYGKKWGAKVGETRINANGKEPIRYIDITPEMRQSVSKGQPLFTAAPAIPAMSFSDLFKESSDNQKPQSSQDSMSERQRTSPVIGAFADLFKAASSAERTQQAQGIAKAFDFPAIAETLDRLSYGEPLTTGKGMTTKMRPETEMSFMALLGAAPTSKPAAAGAMAVGKAGEQFAERVVPNVMARGGLPAEMLNAMATQTQSRALPPAGRSGFGVFDPRFDPRVKEQARLRAMTRDVELRPEAQPAPTVSLVDFEGRPFITSMSDRTAAGGKLIGVDDVSFNRPVNLVGGQDYMFYNPGQVWASGHGPVKQLMKQAQEIKQITGQNPIYMPWRMAPTSGDFSTMTGETMLAYADAAMNKNQKKSLDKQIRQFIPDWVGVSDPASVGQFRSASDKQRKAIKNMMDTNFREKGGLNIGGARLSVSDPLQLNAPEGGLMNVGEIFADQPMIMMSGHPDYPRAVPGRGIGTLSENLNVFQVLPQVVKARGMQNPTAPAQTDLRALQMKPYSGIITNELLKSLGY